jgi:hypothetical protein
MRAQPLFGVYLGAIVIASANARLVDAGDLVTFAMPGARDLMCARVAQCYTGVDGDRWAWLVPVALPGALVKLPTRDLQAGCMH